MDQVWKRMKELAREMAERDKRVSVKAAQAIVLELCEEARVERPPEPALQFLAQEFVAMVQEHTAA